MDLVLFCFTEKWWDWERLGFAGRTAALASRLADHPDVRRMLVVDAPTGASRMVSGKQDGREAYPAVDGVGWLRQARENVFVLDQTRVLPRERHDSAVFALNGTLHDAGLAARLRQATGMLGMDRPVSWLAGPTVAGYALSPRFGPVVVYDAVDEWGAHPAHRRIRSAVLRGYDLIRDRADLVFAVTPLLARRFAGGAPRVAVLPNAAEAMCAQPPAVPRELAAISGPRIGYVGALQDRLDVPLIAALARRMPEASFVLVGPADDPRCLRPLLGIENVYLVGRKAPEDIGAWLAGFDACMLPHRDTALTRNMDPVKLYEYIAAGKPVVASALPGLTHPEDLVRRASTADEWEMQLREALSEGCDAEAARRFAERNTWDARVEVALSHIQAVLASRAGELAGPADRRQEA